MGRVVYLFQGTVVACLMHNPIMASAHMAGACQPVPSITNSRSAADLVRDGLRSQAAGCREQAGEAFRQAIEAPGGPIYQAWGLRALSDLLVSEEPALGEVETLLFDARQRSHHYAWIHAEAWLRYRQGRFAEAAKLLELLVSGKLHHTAWPWAMFYDDLGDSYAALGRPDEARAQWRRALDLSSSSRALANPAGLPWDRQAVQEKLRGGKA